MGKITWPVALLIAFVLYIAFNVYLAKKITDAAAQKSLLGG